ncbi:hypothetical protein [Mesorhizobium muleiense]|uniref:Uncharacterized protein n=1 Tax=Mesorhizobium muleiense TaxID=1004279 RepID=A0A1G8YNF0_9HYPH|nr:hypothetical protein [Mesorhizobium muleiense]MCF6102790.1 hypothetical protein [Mesorhizobium muleiense]SDK03974.1 hypothetical protein SAMN05428953_11123 [Mesorhizobium muleiense]
MNSVEPIKHDLALRRPLALGGPVVYWLVGPTSEQRYDVADQPMQGEMDPFFFLTKHKNFIPHEYPCRTEFAAERRGKRPKPQGVFEPDRVWLPFGSPRVDLSGFWFRPTVVATWASTVLDADSDGRARLRLRTCGGAVLFVNGIEAGWMAPYGRNLEASQDFEVDLVAGANEISIWFDDLAERDARYFFQLDYLRGPAAEQVLPTTVKDDVAAAMEAALDAMHFERPFYSGGEVALVTDVALPVAVDVAVVIEGDFMSIEAPVIFRRRIEAGARRITIAATEDLPADFRHFAVSLSSSGFVARRVFGVEICHAARQGRAPAILADRIGEALEQVSSFAEADTVRALARLATGRGGPETDAIIAAALPAIEDCHDCADFILVPLLWCRRAYGDRIAVDLRHRIDEAILNYRYWMDEPGNDVQWYFSENHALLFHTAAYLGGHLLPDARFVRSGRTGAEQSTVGLARVRAWLDHFEAWEMAEFNSAPYFPIDLKGLTILYALGPDADVRRRAGAAINRLLEIVARSAQQGMLTGAQGRSYEHTLRAARSLELSGIARMLWGKGFYGMRFHALPQLALCLRDHGLHVPQELTGIACMAGDDAQEWCFAQGQNRIAKLYHYKTRDFAMGSAAAYRWNEWGYQETVLHLRLGGNPDAQIWINHPGETIHSGYGRPSYWGGSGSLPRVHQYRDLAVVLFSCAAEQPDFTHAWYPQSAFDEARVKEHIASARGGDGFAMLKADSAFELVGRGPTAGNELRVPGHHAAWIIRLGRRRQYGSLEEFEAQFSPLALGHGKNDLLHVNDPEYGDVLFHPDGRIEAEDRVVDPADWQVTGEATYFTADAIATR